MRLGRRETFGALIVSSSLCTLFVYLCWTQGAMGVSRNDDWTYYRVMFELADHGNVSGDFSSAFFVGQAYLFLPIVWFFGDSIPVLQVGVALLGAIGLWCSYLLMRNFLSVGASVLSLGCLGLGPAFGSLSLSFMTDVPAFSLQAVALLLGARALRSSRTNLPVLIASLTCATLAFTIREFALACGLAVLVATWVREHRRVDAASIRLGMITVGWAVLLTCLYWWRQSLPNSVDIKLEVSPAALTASFCVLAGLALTLALLLTPVVVAAAPLRLLQRVRRNTRWWLPVFAFLLALLVWWRPPLLPGYLAVQTSYDSAVLGVPPEYMPLIAWKLLWFVAAGSASALVLLALSAIVDVRNRVVLATATRSLIGQGSAGVVVVTFVFIYLAVSTASILVTNAPFFDRYLITVLPFAAALVMFAAGKLGLRTRVSDACGWVSLVLVGSYSLGLTGAVAAIDGAKWRLSNHLVSLGYAPAEVAGSMEWWGLKYTGPVVPDVDRPDVPPWWLSMFGERKACAIVAYADPSGEEGQILGIEHVTTLIGSTVTLVAKDVPGCDLGRASKLAGY